MVHSGSRNVGWQVADHYMGVAKMQNIRPRQDPIVPPSWELETLSLEDEVGQAYLRQMRWSLEFALLNRKVMMDLIREAIVASAPGTTFDREVNINHNMALLEEHNGEMVWVHRKGATQALSGQLGIIPGAQGCYSYIVRGLGNPESFQSCSHGAGRKMSRSQARKKLDLEDEIRKMEESGVVHALREVGDLDEAKGAYKDIQQVMGCQTDLVEIAVELFTMGVLKGGGKKKRGKPAKEVDQDAD